MLTWLINRYKDINMEQYIPLFITVLICLTLLGTVLIVYTGYKFGKKSADFDCLSTQLTALDDRLSQQIKQAVDVQQSTLVMSCVDLTNKINIEHELIIELDKRVQSAVNQFNAVGLTSQSALRKLRTVQDSG